MRTRTTENLKYSFKTSFLQISKFFFSDLTRNFANMLFLDILIFFDVISSSFLSSYHEKATEAQYVGRI